MMNVPLDISKIQVFSPKEATIDGLADYKRIVGTDKILLTFFLFLFPYM